MEEVTYKIDTEENVTDVEVKEPEVTIDSETLFAPQRLENETYEAYKERRLVAHYKLHEMAKGKLIWNSRPDATKKGDTYRKVK
jgi:hemin uptake protein HemP